MREALHPRLLLIPLGLFLCGASPPAKQSTPLPQAASSARIAAPSAAPAVSPAPTHFVLLKPGAASPSVELSLADPSPVIGVTGETELRIEVLNPSASSMPMPRVFCSVGQIEDLVRDSPTIFTARYILPAARYPQPAILAAEFDIPMWPLRGMTSIRLRAAATRSIRTDPGAQVTVRVGDREFGPQVAPADGWVHIPLVVPPGIETAIARSVNQYGKSTEQALDLRVPYSQRLLFITPPHMVAGSHAEVAVFAVEPTGKPANAALLELRSAGTKVYPLGSRFPGEARFLVTAPSILKEKSLRIEAQLKGQNTTLLAKRIPLVPGRAAGLTLEPEASHLERSKGASMRVFLGAEDIFGNPVDPSRASVLVNAEPAQVTTDESGDPMVVVTAPASLGRPKEVTVEGVLDMGHAFRRIPVGGKPRVLRPVLRKVPVMPRFTLTSRLGVLWNLGTESGGTLFVDATFYRSKRVPGLGLGLSLGLLETWFQAQSQGGISRTSLSTVPLMFHLRQRFMTDRTFFSLGASIGYARSFSRVRSYGTTMQGHADGLVAEANVETGFLLRDAHLVFSLHYLILYLSDFSSGDRIVGNVGGTMVDVGYRLVW